MLVDAALVQTVVAVKIVCNKRFCMLLSWGLHCKHSKYCTLAVLRHVTYLDFLDLVVRGFPCQRPNAANLTEGLFNEALACAAALGSVAR